MSYISTTYFGLVAVREQTPSVQDWAATYWNWITADKILYAASTSHVHNGLTALADPTGDLDLNVADSGGTLPGGTTYYVAATYLDYLGRETGKSSVAEATTTAIISAPSTPTYVAGTDLIADADLPTPTGYGLSGGNYWYKITYVKGSGETTGSNPVAVVVPSDQIYGVTIHFSSLDTVANGATAINVYRKTGSSGNYVKINQITVTSRDYFTDNNTAVAQCDVQPPTANTTNSFNTLTIDAANLTNMDDAEYIKIYVSTTNDGGATPIAVWTATNMFLTTFDLTAATPVLSYEWTGTARTVGKPPVISQSLPSPSRIDLSSHVEGNLDLATNVTGKLSRDNLTIIGPDGIMEYAGLLSAVDDDTSFWPAQPYYGYGSTAYVWDKGAIYYYEDTFSPDGGAEGWYKTGFSQMRGSFMSEADLPTAADDGDMALVRTDGAATPSTINTWYIYETDTWTSI